MQTTIEFKKKGFDSVEGVDVGIHSYQLMERETTEEAAVFVATKRGGAPDWTLLFVGTLNKGRDFFAEQTTARGPVLGAAGGAS